MTFLFSCLMFLSAVASAEPCFHAGTYQGKGVYTDTDGKPGAYDVTTEIADSAGGKSSYSWTGGKTEEFSFAAVGATLMINGKDIGATVSCGLATETVHLPFPGTILDEEWLFTGNYLLRHGTKTSADGKVEYQELLLRVK